jgi:hypothetical protein
LDRCRRSRSHAGSRILLKAATKSRPQLLWVCGRIPESRGVVRRGPGIGTVIVNAANGGDHDHQNHHPAGRGTTTNPAALVHGPTVIRLRGPPLPRHDRVEILQMSGRYTFMNQDHPAFFFNTATTATMTTPTTTILTSEAEQRSPLLLAVDLGLRTGVSLFNHNGTILKYEQFLFESAKSLREGAEKILRQWPLTTSGAATTITHVAIEGKDPPLAEAWRSAISGLEHPPLLLFVNPEEWRVDLLSEPERRNGASAKASSQYWARRVLSKQQGHHQHHRPAAISTDNNTGKDNDNDTSLLPEDVAESILLGMHISRRLGWIVDTRPSLYCQST